MNIALENPGAAPSIVGSGADTHFYVGDHLGSAQLEFAAGGWPVWQGQYAPFGQELTPSGALLGPDVPDGSSNHYKFTGKERDAESGLDYFGARYYASNMGRWMSPDWADKPEAVPYSSLDNPQSLNLYGYVLNNPLSHADLDGHDCCEGAWNAFAGAVGGVLTPASYRIPMIGEIQPDAHASAGGMAVGQAMQAVIPIGDLSEGAQITRNAAQGKAFQEGVAAEKALTNPTTVQNITRKTESRVKTVMEVGTKDAAGTVGLTEAKSSATARSTPAQAAAHPEIAKTGATVAGKGKPCFPGGTKIPPTAVEVVRPKS